MRLKFGIPASSQATASPSMMQERERWVSVIRLRAVAQKNPATARVCFNWHAQRAVQYEVAKKQLIRKLRKTYQ
jgi:hypothetical protein